MPKKKIQYNTGERAKGVLSLGEGREGRGGGGLLETRLNAPFP